MLVLLIVDSVELRLSAIQSPCCAAPFPCLERLSHTLIYLPVSLSLCGRISSDRVELHSGWLSLGRACSTRVLQRSGFSLPVPEASGTLVSQHDLRAVAHTPELTCGHRFISET